MDERKSLNMPSLDVMDTQEILSECFGTPEEVLDRYTHCPLCHSHLHFTHVTDFSRNLTEETAKCPECTIRVRKVLHKLQ